MEVKKTWKTIRALLLAAILAVVMIPGAVFAADDTSDHEGMVHVVVENTTYQSSDAEQNGVLADEWVEVDEDSTMQSVLIDAVGEENVNITESQYGSYISGLYGLEAGTGADYAGWMFMLNDWFTSESISAYTVADGTLEAGDEITAVYSLTGGTDVGSDYSDNTKTLKDVEFSTGSLNQEFSSDTHEYTLTVSEDVTGVVVTPTATNKNFQVRTSVDGTEYKRTASVPVEDGTVITVICGDPSWPTMNSYNGADEVAAETYTFTVRTSDEVEMYRLYNPNSGEHFYTKNQSERAYLISLGWNDEGIGWIAPVTSSTPVYRLYNPNAGDHHYTASVEERDHLISLGWNDEGIGWYSDDDESVPVYRQYNPNAKAGAHNYTVSESERDHLSSLGWNDEGIGWYGLKTA